jgi:hypothetical protein
VVKQQLANEINSVVLQLTPMLQELFDRFIGKGKAQTFELIKQIQDYVMYLIRPADLIINFAELIAGIYFGFGEYKRCIFICIRCIAYCTEHSLDQRKVPFYEMLGIESLMPGRSYHQSGDSINAIKTFYKMLFLSLYTNDFYTELRALEYLGEQYYEYGDLNHSKYLQVKMAKNIVEKDDSKVRTYYPFLRKFYNRNAKKFTRQLTPDNTPPIEFYESLPLEGSHIYLEIMEKRKEALFKDLDFVRKAHALKKRETKSLFCGASKLSNHELKRKEKNFGLRANIGKITLFEDYKLEDTEFIKPQKDSGIDDIIKPDNNTDDMILTHRSPNRTLATFNKHHQDIAEKSYFNFANFQTYLTEGNLLVIIKQFNACGLQFEKISALIKEYLALLT